LRGDDSRLAGYLQLEGLPVSGIIQSAGWRDMVELHIGVRPADADEGDASKKICRVNTLYGNYVWCMASVPILASG
jgi:hypothetical protein